MVGIGYFGVDAAKSSEKKKNKRKSQVARVWVLDGSQVPTYMRLKKPRDLLPSKIEHCRDDISVVIGQGFQHVVLDLLLACVLLIHALAADGTADGGILEVEYEKRLT